MVTTASLNPSRQSRLGRTVVSPETGAKSWGLGNRIDVTLHSQKLNTHLWLSQQDVRAAAREVLWRPTGECADRSVRCPRFTERSEGGLDEPASADSVPWQLGLGHGLTLQRAASAGMTK